MFIASYLGQRGLQCRAHSCSCLVACRQCATPIDMTCYGLDVWCRASYFYPKTLCLDCLGMRQDLAAVLVTFFPPPQCISYGCGPSIGRHTLTEFRDALCKVAWQVFPGIPAVTKSMSHYEVRMTSSGHL